MTMDMAKWEGFHKQIPMERAPGLSIIGYVLKPESRGTVRITSTDPGVHPEIVHNALSHPYDRKIAVALARFIRELVSQSAIKMYIKNETLPGIQYQTDDELMEAYTMMSGPGFHAAGTCAMGSEESSVLDEKLRVRGLTGLRIADLSVFPTLVSGNTHGPVMAVADKAADIILHDRVS
jgi:choline dehydrogenase-like flavoprotein